MENPWSDEALSLNKDIELQTLYTRGALILLKYQNIRDKLEPLRKLLGDIPVICLVGALADDLNFNDLDIRVIFKDVALTELSNLSKLMEEICAADAVHGLSYSISRHQESIRQELGRQYAQRAAQSADP